jgi:hypothetical protein
MTHIATCKGFIENGNPIIIDEIRLTKLLISLDLDIMMSLLFPVVILYCKPCSRAVLLIMRS